MPEELVPSSFSVKTGIRILQDLIQMRPLCNIFVEIVFLLTIFSRKVDA